MELSPTILGGVGKNSTLSQRDSLESIEKIGLRPGSWRRISGISSKKPRIRCRRYEVLAGQGSEQGIGEGEGKTEFESIPTVGKGSLFLRAVRRKQFP